MKYLYKTFLFLCIITLSHIQIINAQQITLSSPLNSSQYTLPCSIPLEANVTDVTYPDPTYILVQNTQTGFRKLKFGYSSLSVYSPLQNIIASGNNKLEITMKLICGNVDWSKILIKPMGQGSLTLQSYISVIGGLSNSWKTIVIPLSDFGTAIDFTQIANLEFPYSASAAPFEIAISKIKFTGGTNPFTWFGEGKTDNKHNGTGGTGELVASLIQGTAPLVYPKKVEFYANNIKINEDSIPPYQFTFNNLSVGTYTLKARLVMSDNQYYDSPVSQTEVLPLPTAVFTIALTQPQANDTLVPPANVQLTASVTGLYPSQPDHMLVSNSLTGFRKLKFGYSPLNIYAPYVNVINGGNNAIEITLRDINGGIDWSKIQLRPLGLGSLNLQPYVNSVGGIGSEWKTIIIPLSDFTTSIDFAAISNIEFPYSASAGNFQLAIKSIRFTGGSTPFVWFGFGKIDNKHNGNGGSGELVANLVLGNSTGDYIEKVEFYSANNKIGEDFDQPYNFSLNALPQANYTFFAKVFSHNGLSASSAIKNIVVYSPPITKSTMTVNITSPVSGTSCLAPLNLPVKIDYTGAVEPGPDYLNVINSLTGFVKLKMGYSPTSFTSPKQNVIAGGNDTIELVIRNYGGPVDWSKIRFRPSGIGFVTLDTYANKVGGIGNEWKTLKIPLNAFDTTIDFKAISFIEFPYSAGANNFQIGVQKIKFIGGSYPFTWFGDGKTNNITDGDGIALHLKSSIISPNAIAVDAAKVKLFDNGVLIGEDSQPPFAITLTNPQAGNHKLSVQLTDSHNRFAYSDTVDLNVFTEIPQGSLLVTVNFDQPPTNISVNKAPLRYNKDFAYSVSFDDGLIDAYTCAFKLMGGGFSTQTSETYPGLFYTNGCGKSIPFKGSLMWNSVNGYNSDIHINTPSYVNWTQLNQMLDSGWAVVNHAYSHSIGEGTDYIHEIAANDSMVFSHTGFRMNHFVAPSGDANYFPTAWQQGIKCSYSRQTTNGSPSGLKIDNPLNYSEFMIYRDFKSDDNTTPSSIANYLDNCSLLSQNGNHYWYNDFTHHVSPNQVGGSLLFSTFKPYMEHIASTYGEAGSDRVWAASGMEVFEYLKLRDACPLTWSVYGNQLRILINRNNAPTDLLRYAMSLVIDADANITSVQLNDNAEINYRGNTPQKLIDIQWESPINQSIQPKLPSNQNELTQSNDNLLIQQVSHTNIVNMSLIDKTTINGIVKVYDIQGRLIKNLHIEGNVNTSNISIDLPTIHEGLYIIIYLGDNGTKQTSKFLYKEF